MFLKLTISLKGPHLNIYGQKYIISEICFKIRKGKTLNCQSNLETKKTKLEGSWSLTLDCTTKVQ